MSSVGVWRRPAAPPLAGQPAGPAATLSQGRASLMETRVLVRLALGAVATQVGTTIACTDSGNFAGSLLPCTDGGCSTTTMTCAQLAAIGGCEKHFGELFDYSADTAAPTCSQQFSFDATTAVALGCCSTCNVDAMSAKEVDDLIGLFKKFDQDGDGSIDQSELKALLHVSGIDATDAQVATVLADDDTDGDGRIEFAEFVGIVHQNRASHPPTVGTGSCVERTTTVSGQTLSCSHYVQLGYTCQALTTTPQFMNDFDCHCSCPGANAHIATAPGAKHCNTPALSAACSDPSVMTPAHLCDNICSVQSYCVVQAGQAGHSGSNANGGSAGGG